MTASLLLAVRALHILLAALWVGAIFLMTAFVIPAVRDLGAAGGSFMVSLGRRGIHVFMASTAGLTVLSGLWLYWMFTNGFDHGAMQTHGGMVFGIGGLCGLLAAIIGGGVVGRSFKRVVAMSEQTATLPESERAAHIQRIADLRGRISNAAKIVLALAIVALLLMAIGHYV